MDRIAQLQQSIESVSAQSHPAKEIIVVCDNNDELEARVRRKYPEVRVLANSETQGLSGARNTGLAAASGDVIAFLDDDARASKDWLEHLSQPYADPSIMAVGGEIVADWPDARPVWFPREFDWVIGCSYIGQPENGGAVRNLIGCNMSVRAEVAAAVGGFRNGLGRVGDNASGCEETDYFIRAHQVFPDKMVYLEPRARVHHSISEGRTKWRYFFQRCRAEGLAKASLVTLVGRNSGLSSEASYVKKVLPFGILKGLQDGLRGDFGGFARAFAIVFGFLTVASAYLMGRAVGKFGPAKIEKAPFKPLRILDVEPEDGLQDLKCRDPETGEQCSAAWVLVRSNGQPAKILEIPFFGRDIPATELAECIEADRSEMPPAPLLSPTENSSPKVSVIISTRNRPDSLARCLDSLLVQTYGDFDIIVVDNAPSDASTLDLIESRYAASGRVRYVRENIPGLARAHNTGVAHACGEILAFTDDDVIADPNWVSSIAANFAYSDKIGCVTGMILPAELLTQAQVWTERHGGFGKGLFRRVFDINVPNDHGPLFPYTAGAFGSGANMAFRRETLEKMGGFVNALGAGTIARGGDDLASFVAALKTGDQLVYEPGAMVWHFHRREEEGMRRQAYGYGMGLGAYLTHQITRDPRTLLFLLRKFPAAFMHLFSKKSEKMSRLPDNYPRRLVWMERLGILMGLPNYVRSRIKERPMRSVRVGSVVRSRN